MVHVPVPQPLHLFMQSFNNKALIKMVDLLLFVIHNGIILKE